MLAAGDDVPCLILPDARFAKPNGKIIATLARGGVCTKSPTHPVWNIDPQAEPFKTIGHSSHRDTRPAVPDPKAQSVVYQDIITNMYAKAAAGTCAKVAIGLG